MTDKIVELYVPTDKIVGLLRPIGARDMYLAFAFSCGSILSPNPGSNYPCAHQLILHVNMCYT
jgi:hypothetical protein